MLMFYIFNMRDLFFLVSLINEEQRRTKNKKKNKAKEKEKEKEERRKKTVKV